MRSAWTCDRGLWSANVTATNREWVIPTFTSKSNFASPTTSYSQQNVVRHNHHVVCTVPLGPAAKRRADCCMQETRVENSTAPKPGEGRGEGKGKATYLTVPVLRYASVSSVCFGILGITRYPRYDSVSSVYLGILCNLRYTRYSSVCFSILGMPRYPSVFSVCLGILGILRYPRYTSVSSVSFGILRYVSVSSVYFGIQGMLRYASVYFGILDILRSTSVCLGIEGMPRSTRSTSVFLGIQGMPRYASVYRGYTVTHGILGIPTVCVYRAIVQSSKRHTFYFAVVYPRAGSR